LSPEPALHTVPDGATTSPGHGALATPVQTSSGSQRSPDPVRQVVPDGAIVSAGQLALLPSQDSSGSQRSPDPALQSVPDGCTSSAGQTPLLQVSATSHAPVTPRQSVPSGSAARQLSPTSLQDSAQFVSLSCPRHVSPLCQLKG